jgi:hypothetical protein
MNLFLKSILFFIAIYFISCNSAPKEEKEVARLSFDKATSSLDSVYEKAVSIDLEKGDVLSFWAEMDVEYEGEMGFRFEVKPFRDTTSLGILKLDPYQGDFSTLDTVLDLGDRMNWQFATRLRQVTISHDDNYTFKAILVSARNESLIIKKADLVLKTGGPN